MGMMESMGMMGGPALLSLPPLPLPAMPIFPTDLNEYQADGKRFTGDRVAVFRNRGAPMTGCWPLRNPANP